jgi:hypothetical protein
MKMGLECKRGIMGIVISGRRNKDKRGYQDMKRSYYV